MSSPSPVTDGRHVWVMTGTGILKAFDFEGKERGRATSRRTTGRFGQHWGYGSSPLLFEDSLYVQVLHGMHTDDPSYLLRIDKATGKTIWRVERPTKRGSSRPTPTRRRRCCATATRRRSSSPAATWSPATIRRPAELWRADGLNPTNDGSYRIVASPFVHGD